MHEATQESHRAHDMVLTPEDLRDLILAYDAKKEIEAMTNRMLSDGISSPTTPDGDSLIGKLGRIWNVIYRHTRFYPGLENSNNSEEQIQLFNALGEYLENEDLDIDERVRGIFN